MKPAGKLLQLFLDHTPVHTHKFVQKGFEASGIPQIKDQALIDPIVYYMESLNKHKEYLDFFQIGVYRDQRKKIENVAKYVGLAIRGSEDLY